VLGSGLRLGRPGFKIIPSIKLRLLLPKAVLTIAVSASSGCITSSYKHKQPTRRQY
jgi:hypothetical protein